MKQLIKSLAVFATTSTIALTAALGQGGPLITLDELGKMTINGAPQPPGTIAQDPFSGIFTLSYQLPFVGIRGDVVMFEPGPVPAPVSDVLRFDGNFHVFFFSEREATDNTSTRDPADMGLPGPFPGGLQPVNLVETGVEGNDGAFYTPGNGPGGDPSSNPSYDFISDVPEPGAGLLLSLGGGLLWILKGRRQERRN
jgi:hypothetical protein